MLYSINLSITYFSGRKEMMYVLSSKVAFVVFVFLQPVISGFGVQGLSLGEGVSAQQPAGSTMYGDSIGNNSCEYLKRLAQMLFTPNKKRCGLL